MVLRDMGWRGNAGGWATAAVCGAVLLMVPARGQDDRLVTTPPLEQAFPLENKFGEVKLKFPVLLNQRTILGPEVTLRFIYIDPAAGMGPHGGGGGAGGGGLGGGGMHHHQGGGASGGDGFDDASAGGHPTDAMPDPLSKNKATAKELDSEVWHDVTIFQQALGTANDLGTMLVFARPGEKKPRSAMIDPPGGMLLAEVGGHVEVLALTSDSEAAAAGLQPGDQIDAVGGKPVSSLRDFSTAYFATTEHALKDGQPYSFQVSRRGEAAPVTIQVGAPPSLMHLM